MLNMKQVTETKITPWATELAEIISFLQRRSLLRLTKQVSATKISIPQYTLLGFLYSHESLNMGQLATFMGHTTPATTGLIDRLTEAGLVERSHLPLDRRQVIVKITPKGRQIVEDIKSDLANCVTRIGERLSADDRDAWLRIYQEIRKYCEECEQA